MLGYSVVILGFLVVVRIMSLMLFTDQTHKSILMKSGLYVLAYLVFSFGLMTYEFPSSDVLNFPDDNENEGMYIVYFPTEFGEIKSYLLPDYDLIMAYINGLTLKSVLPDSFSTIHYSSDTVFLSKSDGKKYYSIRFDDADFIIISKLNNKKNNPFNFEKTYKVVKGGNYKEFHEIIKELDTELD